VTIRASCWAQTPIRRRPFHYKGSSYRTPWRPRAEAYPTRLGTHSPRYYTRVHTTSTCCHKPYTTINKEESLHFKVYRGSRKGQCNYTLKAIAETQKHLYGNPSAFEAQKKPTYNYHAIRTSVHILPTQPVLTLSKVRREQKNNYMSQESLVARSRKKVRRDARDRGARVSPHPAHGRPSTWGNDVATSRTRSMATVTTRTARRASPRR
jgi:hypothetical protein